MPELNNLSNKNKRINHSFTDDNYNKFTTNVNRKILKYFTKLYQTVSINENILL